MKTHLQLVLLALSVCSLVPAALVADRQVHVVMISIDGLMPATYTQPGPAKVPTLRKMAREGAHAEGVVGVLPSVTYPSHTTLITGVPPSVHGIFDNRILDPEGRSNGAWFWYARDIRVPTLVGSARSRGLRAAAVNWPVSIGLDADFLIPEFERSRHPEALTLLRALSTPNLLDAIELAQRGPLAWPVTDKLRAEAASYILRAYQPHVTLLHLVELDSAQHTYGPGAPEALETVERLDGYVAGMLQVLEEVGLQDRTYVAIVSDHGFRALERQLQPNALFKQEGLLKTDARGIIVEWQAYFHASGGSGYVYLKDPSNTALRARVHTLLKTLAANPENGIEALWTSDDLARRGAHPDATFGISMAKGFYSAVGHDVLLKAASSKGGHGFDPTKPELYASLVVTGPGLRGRGSLGVVPMTKIAPTLARLLEVGLSPRADQPIEAIVAAAGSK